MLSPTFAAVKESFPRLGKSTLETPQNRLLNWSKEEGTAVDSATETAQRKAKTFASSPRAGASATLFLLLRLRSERQTLLIAIQSEKIFLGRVELELRIVI